MSNEEDGEDEDSKCRVLHLYEDIYKLRCLSVLYKASDLVNIEEVLFLVRQWMSEGNRMEMLEVGILFRYFWVWQLCSLSLLLPSYCYIGISIRRKKESLFSNNEKMQNLNIEKYLDEIHQKRTTILDHWGKKQNGWSFLKYFQSTNVVMFQ